MSKDKKTLRLVLQTRTGIGESLLEHLQMKINSNRIEKKQINK